MAKQTLPPPLNSLVAGNHTVSTRFRWTLPWTVATNMHCEEAVWCAAPSLPTATLRWHYGMICPFGKQTFQEILKKAGYERLFVKIDFNLRQTVVSGVPTWETKTWYGTIEVNDDRHDGTITEPATFNDVATGEQLLTCYGMEHLLDREYPAKSWIDQDDAGTIVAIERACTFNRDGKPNRSANATGGTFHFSNIAATSTFWSTRDIVEYLLRYHSPTDAFGANNVPFQLSPIGLAAVANWDQPVVHPEGRSVYSLLTSLLARQRLIGFHFETPDPLTYLQPWTFTGTAINTKPGGAPIPANNNKLTLVFDKDQSADAVVKVSTVEQYDQLIIRGARRRAVFTVSWQDGTLVAGWGGLEQAIYDQGASLLPGYAAMTVTERRKANAEARAVEYVKHVYRRFKIVEPWNGLAGNGIGGAKTFPFREINLTTLLPQQVPHFDREVFVEKTMPLLEGVDYSGDKIFLGTLVLPTGNASEMPPLVFWQNPDTLSYQRIETMADAGPLTDDLRQQLDWSATVVVPDEDRAIQLVVSGAPQHVLDQISFLPTAEDEDQGTHNWRAAVVTLSVQEDRYAEIRFPNDGVLQATIPTNDYARRLVLDAGDQYRLDYVNPGTVVDVGPNGLIFATNGGFLNDDRNELLAIARVAHAFYNRKRRVLYFSSEQATSTINLGDFISFISQPDLDGIGTHRTAIDTPITEIRMQTPMGTSEDIADPPRMHWTTDAGQLDAIGLFGGPPVPPAPIAPAPPAAFAAPAAAARGSARPPAAPDLFNPATTMPWSVNYSFFKK